MPRSQRWGIPGSIRKVRDGMRSARVGENHAERNVVMEDCTDASGDNDSLVNSQVSGRMESCEEMAIASGNP